MASIKLFYFTYRGRGEVSRLLLAASGQAWDDVRFSGEEWPKYKPNAPFGQAPYLEHEGKTYCQSVAIGNFLARLYGFYGKTSLDAVVIDQVVQTIQDLWLELVKIYYEKDDGKKNELTEKLRTEHLPKYLNFFKKLLKENNSNRFFVGKQLSLADIALYDVIVTVKEFLKSDDICKDYPEIKKVSANVEANPNIKKYLDIQAKAKE